MTPKNHFEINWPLKNSEIAVHSYAKINQIDDFNCFNENQQNIASFFYIPFFSGLFDPICTDAFFFHFNFQKLVKSHHAKIIFKNIVKLKVLQFEV